MLNQASIAIADGIVLKVRVNRDDLTQYFNNVKTYLAQRSPRIRRVRDEWGREVQMIPEGEDHVRHMVDWETIYRYWKKVLKGKPVDEAERMVVARINELIDIYRRCGVIPATTMYRQPVDSRSQANPANRLTMNVSLLYLLEMNNPDNLFMGEGGYNSTLGQVSSHSKNTLKANYPGERANVFIVEDGYEAEHVGYAFDGTPLYREVPRRTARMQTIQRHAMSKQHSYMLQQEAITGRSSDKRRDFFQRQALKHDNKNARLDLGSDDPHTNWNIDAEKIRRARERFDTIWHVAWGQKGGKY